MIEWTAEEIAKRSTEEIQSLRDNAAKRGKQGIVDLCESELARRKPASKQSKAKNVAHEERLGHYVSEFHFVCPGELGITKNQDGSIWSGTWVVAEAHAEAAREHGSLIALHSAKAELSYLQGTIKDWRKTAREPKYSGDQLVKTDFGIDFLFEPTSGPMPWKGEATGEKGYAWAPVPPAQAASEI
jgi:hypothetical protein